MSKVLLTGASGFLGNSLLSYLEDKSIDVIPASRKKLKNKSFQVSNIDNLTNWFPALGNVSKVIHTAACVHEMNDKSERILTEYRQVNVEGTLNLAEQASKSGVKRFVFISSIKVNGEESVYNKPFTPTDIPAPFDPYAVSKLEAEKGLNEISLKTGMEIVIIRPPMIYGPGVRGNFLSLMKIINKRIPLPLGAINFNYRSLVSLENLNDLLYTCLDHPKASNQTFLVSDGVDMSTSDLLLRISKAMGIRPNLLTVPNKALKFGAFILGKNEHYRRLAGSLQLDISETKKKLKWEPPCSVEVSMEKTVKYFLDNIK